MSFKKSVDEEPSFEFLLESLETNQKLYTKHPRLYMASLPWYVHFYDKKLLKDIEYYGRFDPYYQPLKGRARRRFLRDIMLWNYVYGYEPEDYFEFDFAIKSKEDRLTYLNTLEMGRYLFSSVSKEAKEKFLDAGKWAHYQLFQPMFHRDVAYLNQAHDGDDLFLEFAQKHPEFIVKPINDYGGHGIHKFSVVPGHEAEGMEELRKEAPVLVEELLQQSAEMNYLNTDSVNTLRVVTFQGGGQFEIAFVILRIGRANMLVDNVTSGGLAMYVDQNTHRTGHRLLCDTRVQDNTRHPDSGVELSNFLIPDWDGMVDLVRQGTELIPRGMHYCGWDLCHTDHGWSLVEANETAAYDLWSLFTGKGEAEYFRTTLQKYVKLEEASKR